MLIRSIVDWYIFRNMDKHFHNDGMCTFRHRFLPNSRYFYTFRNVSKRFDNCVVEHDLDTYLHKHLLDKLDLYTNHNLDKRFDTRAWADRQ